MPINTVKREIAFQLQEIIDPYYKGIPLGDSAPEFRKSLSSDEIVNLLLSIHKLSVKLLIESDSQ